MLQFLHSMSGMGGLSIIGGILGGCLAGFVFSLLKARKEKTLLRSMTNFCADRRVGACSTDPAKLSDESETLSIKNSMVCPLTYPGDSHRSKSSTGVGPIPFTHFHPLFCMKCFSTSASLLSFGTSDGNWVQVKTTASYLLLYGFGPSLFWIF